MYEVYHTQKSGAKFEVAMSAKQREAFETALARGGLLREEGLDDAWAHLAADWLLGIWNRNFGG